jgi:phage terminase small subunit
MAKPAKKPKPKAKAPAKAKKPAASKPSKGADNAAVQQAQDATPKHPKDMTYDECMELDIPALEAACATGKELRLAHEWRTDQNATQAAIRAGYSRESARWIGYELLAKPYMRALTDKLRAEDLKRAGTTADDVLARIGMIAKGDPRALTQWRVRCCRHCWGINFLYQETPAERHARHADHIQTCAEKEHKDLPPPQWDELGGVGYDGRKPPNPECPECWGEGEGYLYIPDSRDLPPEAVALFAGVKETKDGIEVKTISQEKALEMLAKAHKVYEDKNEVTINLNAETMSEKFVSKMQAAHERMEKVRQEREGG